jgi:hypothetical protein
MTITTYAKAAAHMERARSVAKGRPMARSGWRMFKDGDEYVVTVYDTQVGRFLPNNTFLFTMSTEHAYSVQNTLSAIMQMNIPFYWRRKSKMRYCVLHIQQCKHGYYTDMKSPDTPEYYEGIAFDLTTGECLNKRERAPVRTIAEKQKEWLAAKRKWLTVMRTIARIGGFDDLLRDPRTSYIGPWSKPAQLHRLYEIIRDCDCSPAVVKMFVASGYATNASEVMNNVESIVRMNTLELRKKFGAAVEGQE